MIRSRGAHVDIAVFTLHAVLTQLLSNLISPTSGHPGADRIAEDKLALYLSGTREDDVIMWVNSFRWRSDAHPRAKADFLTQRIPRPTSRPSISQTTSLAILVLDCRLTLSSPARPWSALMCCSVRMLDGPGLRWVSKILGRMDDWHEAHDGRFELA
jgi:ataxin-10